MNMVASSTKMSMGASEQLVIAGLVPAIHVLLVEEPA